MKGNLTCSDNCGMEFFDPFARILMNLDALVQAAGFHEIHINSGPRCVKHNADVGGVTNSAHLRGIAADIAFSDGGELYALIRTCIEVGIRRIGIDDKRKFIHIDVGQKSQGFPSPFIWMYK
jgi:uncharacterized protein YcbK (DUF882 family)